MTKKVKRDIKIWETIRCNNTHQLVPVCDLDRPIRSIGDMMTWYTAKPCAYTRPPSWISKAEELIRYISNLVRKQTS